MANERTPRLPTVWEALIPVVFMMFIIILSTVYWGMDPHMPIVASSVVATLVAMKCGNKFSSVLTGGLDGIKRTVEALIIIMCVGMLIGSWVWSGTMPAMVYYGLELIAPQAFLVVGAILTFIVGVSTGSSWTASGTVGVALMGVAMGLGINPALAAGMVISGAYTGDKLSPLSDSTNVAAAGAETPLYDHVAAMMTTTIPSFLIALVLYGIAGRIVIDPAGYDPTLTLNIQAAIADNFNITPWVLIPVIIVIFGAIKRIPAIPSLLFAAAVACVIAIVFQGAAFSEVFAGLQTGFSIDSGNAVADNLLNRGGIDSMMWTISLIMFALYFGGVLEQCGFVEVLLGGVVKRVKTVGGLVSATIVTGIICNVVLTDQYLAILVPGRMFAKSFDDRGLSRSFLSRTTEDGATLWSPMIPWNGCGAYQAATLGVHNFAFAPYAFMNLINPVLAIVMTYLGIGIKYKEEDGKTRAEIKELRAKRKNAK